MRVNMNDIDKTTSLFPILILLLASFDATALADAPAGRPPPRQPAARQESVPARATMAIERAERLLDRGDELAAAAAYREALRLAAESDSAVLEEWLAEAELSLARLRSLRARHGTAGADREVLELWAARDDAPFVAATARRDLGFVLLALGRERSEADAAWAPLFHLDNWHIVGPFDNERGGGFRVAYGPEKEIDLAGTYDGKSRPVAWRPLPATPMAGRVDLGALLEPNEEALAYAVTFVHSETAQPAALRIGAKNGFRVWINGAEVASKDLERPFRREQDSVGIHLLKGWNTVLFKLPQSKGSWRFAVRLTRPDGTPLLGAKEGRPAPDASLPRLSEAAAPPPLTPDPTARLLARLSDESGEGAPEAARVCYVLGSLLRLKNAHDESEHPDTRWLARAVGLDESQPVYHVELAKSRRRSTTIAAQQEENAWRRSMEAAYELESAVAAYGLARHYYEQFGNRTRALDYLDAVLERNPRFEAAIHLRGVVENDLGFPGATRRAEKTIGALATRSAPARVQAAGESAGRGAIDRAIEELRAILDADAFQSSARRRLAGIYQRTGRDEEALALLRSGAELAPFSTSWHLDVAAHFDARDRFDEAIDAIDAALRLRPEDVRLHERRADLLRREGDRSGAIASLDEVVRLRPNSPRIREYLEFLRAAEDALENDVRRDIADIVDAALEAAGEPEGLKNDGDDPARVLFELTAVAVNQDGTTKEFHQNVIQILNDRGVRLYDSIPVYHAPGEQQVEFKKGRVHHADGTVTDAKSTLR